MELLRVLDWNQEDAIGYDPTHPYEEFVEAQKHVWEERVLNLIPDTLLLTYHPPTITLKQYSIKEQLRHIKPLPREWLDEPDNVLFKKAKEFLKNTYQIHLVTVKRGGNIWYHDPGVLQLYLILETDPFYVTAIVDPLEEVLFRIFKKLSLPAERFPERKKHIFNKFIGVWVRGRKIGAIGVRLQGGNKKQISSFGASLNINPNMKNFSLIDPCGIEGAKVTSIEQEMGGNFPSTHEWILPVIYEQFRNVFKREIILT